MNTNNMNGTEKIAYNNIKGVFDWEVGGWYNCIQDNCLESIPDSIEEAKEIIYEESLNDYAEPGHFACGRAPKEMRFAGTEFIKKVIDQLFDEDEDITEIGLEKNWFDVKETEENEVEEDLSEAMRCESHEDALAETKKSHKFNSLREELEANLATVENITVFDKNGLITFAGNAKYLFDNRCKTLLNTTVKEVVDHCYYLNRKYLPIKVK